jgi:hypothetical protein
MLQIIGVHTTMPAKKDKKSSMLPKAIGGVKIPKALRRQGHHLVELARHPVVADLLAAGLVALAASLRESPKAKAAATDARKTVDKAAKTATRTVKKAVKTTRKAADSAEKIVAAAPAAAAKPVKRVRKAATPKVAAAKAAAPKVTTPKTTH